MMVSTLDGHRMNMPGPSSWFATSPGDVCVCGRGARTALGFNATASAAAVRAAISGLRVHPVFVDKVEEPVAFASDAELRPDVNVSNRMRRMLAAAITEALPVPRSFDRDARISCVIGLPESRPGLPADIATTTASAVADAFSSAVGVHVLPRGHVSGLMAMQLGAQRIASGEVDLCLAAGVDSYHDPTTVAWLDENGFLMSSANRNGFPPGEAAGACLLASQATARRFGLPVIGSVVAACTAIEQHTIRGTDVCIGAGLSAAIRAVTSRLRLPHQAVTATYCDLNGQRYRSEEFMYALLRTQDAFVDANEYMSPADCWGDVGAASGPLFACLAIIAAEREYAKGAYPLLWASAESGYRTAVLLNVVGA